MKKRVYIIHRWDGSPEADWYPWLKSELEKRDFNVTVPAMPDPEKPDINHWSQYLDQIIGQPDKNTFLVGHSIGCRAILRYLEHIDGKIGGAILIAGWVALKNLTTEEEKEVARPWLEPPADYEEIRRRCEQFIAIFSDNDKFVPLLENKKTYEEKLRAKIIIENNQGHFTEEDGVTALPSVLQELLSMSARI